ncbi:MAG TPA: methyl-accepting chemotaxis protein [Kineosporiaceae bacterium]|jgi:methyl-accepting chemotaxis protein|nr:methyl-accepting chemotaxis protein [Kineosporiaceae bacterium]
MRRFARLSIGIKMLIVAGVSVTCVIAVGLFTARQLREVRFADREASTRSVVQTALGVVAHYGEQEASGALTRKAAQAQALSELRSLRYGSNDYFWVNDLDARMIMHPIKPQLDGTDVSGMKDPNGVPIFVRFVETVKAHGQGFVSYQWPKPGAKDPQPKISYVEGYDRWGWVIGSGIYVDDVNAAVLVDLRVLGIEVMLAALVVCGALAVTRRSITRPLHRMTRLLVDGDLTRRLDEGRNRTELDLISAAINSTLAHVAAIVDQVVTAAGSITEHVNSLEINTRQIEVQAADTSRQAEDAASSSEAVVAGYDRVARAVGDIDASIRMIAENVQQVAAVAGEAVRATEGTNQIVARLGDSSAEIDAVVQTITSIAEQTNMLALNATIESARAGEAGRGFAVVATEVKDLAHETARATEDIAHRIQTLQNDTSESVTAIGSIAEIIAQINEHQVGIAAAVEEQSATMAEVSRSVSESSQAGAGAGASISAVAVATDQTRRQLDDMTQSICSLSQLSKDLQDAVSVFRH